MRIEPDVNEPHALHIALDEPELRLLQQVLNTAAYGPVIQNLESNIGTPVSTMQDWLDCVSNALEPQDSSSLVHPASRFFDPTVPFPEGLALARLNHEVLSYLAEEEYFTLTGFDLADGEALLSKFNTIFHPRLADRHKVAV